MDSEVGLKESRSVNGRISEVFARLITDELYPIQVQRQFEERKKKKKEKKKGRKSDL